MLVGCGIAGRATDPDVVREIAAADRESLRSARILFGHQSVGDDILAGLTLLAPGLPIVTPADSAAQGSGVLIGAHLGHNGDPAAKDAAFLELVAGLRAGDVALYKYCYADMLAETDPDALCAAYLGTLDSAAARGVRTVAVTMPLTAAAPAWKRLAKQWLGRVTDVELNRKRQRFNEQLRRFPRGHPLIDLARMEATAHDGCPHRPGLEVLRPEFSRDGAHLNERGRERVAASFATRLASVVAER